MAEHEPVPKSMYVDGKPWFEYYGGGAVTMIGKSVNLFTNSEKDFLGHMRREGHTITNRFSSVVAMKSIPKLFEGELGVVVVMGEVLKHDYFGEDLTRSIPEILRDYGEEPPVIFADLSLAKPEFRSELLSRGYEAFIEDDHSLGMTPTSVLRDTASYVTELYTRLSNSTESV